MRTVLRLTVAKIRAHIYRSVFQSGAVATTAFTLSFLLIFSINASALRVGFKESHFTKFLSEMADALGTSLLLVGLIAAVSVFVYMRIWHENGEIFSGRLASVGANEGQLAAISFVELTVLYLVPVFVGTSLGAPVAGLVTGWMSSSLSIRATGVMGVTEALLTSTLTAAGLFALILIFALTPTSRKKRGTVIERIKRHNKDEIGERHGYRNSRTFRNMPPEKRLAKKCVSYYKSSYSRIAAMLTATLAYAVVAALFLKTFLLADIDVDATLYQEALSMIGRLFGFFLGLFSLLFLFGIIQLAYMIKLQNKAREQAYNVYRSLGMTEREINRTALCEYRSIIAWSIIAVVFLAIVIFGLFS